MFFFLSFFLSIYLIHICIIFLMNNHKTISIIKENIFFGIDLNQKLSEKDHKLHQFGSLAMATQCRQLGFLKRFGE